MSSTLKQAFYSPFNHRLIYEDVAGIECDLTPDAFRGDKPNALLGFAQHIGETPLSANDSVPETLERTLKVRVAAANPDEADFIEEILRAWQMESETVSALCEELYQQGNSLEKILEHVLSTARKEYTVSLMPAGGRRRLRALVPGLRSVREGAFMEWRETHWPRPKRPSRKAFINPDDGSEKLFLSTSTPCWDGIKQRPKRTQFRVSSATEAIISPDNSEIVLFVKDENDTALENASCPKSLMLRFRVFSMGRKSIRRLMRNASGNRSGVKHFGVAFVGDTMASDSLFRNQSNETLLHSPEYFFYLCYDGCEKRQLCQKQTANARTAGSESEQIHSSPI
jgi:hypothetical protein